MSRTNPTTVRAPGSQAIALLGLLGLLASLAGCGDNQTCGDGTALEDGVCAPSAECGEGTRYNAATELCEVDPSSCQGGTVLIDNRCQDPANGLLVDLHEGSEPNGSNGRMTAQGPTPDPGFQSAGQIALKPVGSGSFTVRGCITPRDGNADLDAYTLSVEGPTLLHVSVDGVGGLWGGFAVFYEEPASYGWARLGIENRGGWVRVGVASVGDTTKREVFLPSAGNYTFFVSDSRTFLPLIGRSPVYSWDLTLPVIGDPNGTSCYYMSVAQRTPVVVPLADAPSSLVRTDEIRFFSLDLPEGMTRFVPTYPFVNQPRESQLENLELLLMNGPRLREIGTLDGVLWPGREQRGSVLFANRPGDVLVVDDRGSLGEFTYTLDRTDLAVTPLSSIGDTIVSTVKGTRGAHVDVSTGAVPEVILGALNVFSIDAPSPLFTLQLQSSLPLQATLVNAEGDPIGHWGNAIDYSAQLVSFTNYGGIVRVPSAGRYYFWAVSPPSAVGDPFSVTSRVTPVPVLEVNPGVPSGALTPGDRNVTYLNYNTVSESGSQAPWHQINATGTNTGDLLVTLYHPGADIGRLDELSARDEFGTDTELDPDGYPLATRTLPDDGSAPFAQLTTGFPKLLVRVQAAAPGPNPTFSVDFGPHPTAIDLGALARGNAVTRTGLRIENNASGNVGRFFFQAQPLSVVTVTATPTEGFDTEDSRLVIAMVDREGTDIAVWDSGGAGEESARFRQTEPVWSASAATAFEVRSMQPGATGTYDLTVRVEAPFYQAAESNTAFEDICSPATIVPLTADGSTDWDGVPYPADVRGLSAPIDTPDGFAFYGVAVDQLVVSSLGFLSFDASLTQAAPSQPGKVNITPHAFSDFFSYDSTEVCAVERGSRLAVQWRGVLDDYPIQMQAILDGSDGSIEFVYGSEHFTRASWNMRNGVWEPGGGVDSTTTQMEQPETSVRFTAR